MKKVSSALNKVLVIDDVPVIAFGLLETFTALNRSVTVSYEATIFSALSSTTLATQPFDLLVVGVLPGSAEPPLWNVLHELKKQFGYPRLMLYASDYNPAVIEKMEQLGIDAYVHRYESLKEIQKAYMRISADERYISELFYTLYRQSRLAG